MKKKSIFSAAEQKIISALYIYTKPMTVNEISKVTELSWNTVNKYVDKLAIDKWIIKIEKNEKTYWKLDY